MHFHSVYIGSRDISGKQVSDCCKSGASYSNPRPKPERGSNIFAGKSLLIIDAIDIGKTSYHYITRVLKTEEMPLPGMNDSLETRNITYFIARPKKRKHWEKCNRETDLNVMREYKTILFGVQSHVSMSIK